MPAVPLDFRAICGTFRPARSKIFKMAEYDFGSEIPDLKSCLISGLSSMIGPVLCVTLIILRFNNLLLCGDIEENPGPATGPTVADIETINGKLDSIIEGMKFQTNALNEQKQLLTLQAEKMSKYEKGQHEMKQDIDGLRQEIAFLRDQNEKHEQYSRRKNIRLYDVPEIQGREDGVNTVSNILNKYFPENDLQIERAHRIGRKRRPHENPRPLICRFLDWRDAMTVMKAREVREQMRKDGINIAQDLTMNQFEQLRSLKTEGKRGYFYRGKIYEKEFPSIYSRNQGSKQPPANENSLNIDLPNRQSPSSNEEASFLSRQSSFRVTGSISGGSETQKQQNDPQILAIQNELERQKAITTQQKEQSELLKTTNGKGKTSFIPLLSKNSSTRCKPSANSENQNGPMTRSKQPKINESMMACVLSQSKANNTPLTNPSSTDARPESDLDAQMSDDHDQGNEGGEEALTWG